MRYLVMSDIHGGANEVEKILSYKEQHRCSVIILLGDLLNHGPRNRLPESYNPQDTADLLNAHASRIISVRGNCDSEVDTMMFTFPCNAPYNHLYIKCKDRVQKIFLTHGHLFDIKSEEGCARAGLEKGDIVLSGHTHVSGIFHLDTGIININPGSTTLPKGNTQAGFAVITDEAIELYSIENEMLNSYKFS